MRIDIDLLSETELIELNHRIIARLGVLRGIRAHEGMLAFQIGDRVAFQPPGHTTLLGVLTRYNRKTVTVITDEGGQWNVSPQLLSRVVSRSAPDESGTNVVTITKR